MTKDVLVRISGVQFDVGDDAVELVVPGTYYLKNGKHYVLFEEQAEDNSDVIKNMVKFDNDFYEMIKKGQHNVCLRFDKDKKNSSIYQTPVGPMQMDVVTHAFSVKETEDEIEVLIKYALDINYQFVSECEVRFQVQARK